MRARITGTVAAAVVLLAAAGCGSDGSDESLPELSPSTPATTSESPSAAASPSADATAIPSRYPRLELTFDLPEVAGAKAKALRTMVSFERGIQSTFRTARVSPLVREFGSVGMVSFAHDNASYLRTHDTRFAGSTTITVERVQASDRVAVVDTCIDGSRGSQVVQGTPRPLDPPLRAAVRFTLNRSGAGWVVVSRDGQDGKSC